MKNKDRLKLLRAAPPARRPAHQARFRRHKRVLRLRKGNPFDRPPGGYLKIGKTMGVSASAVRAICRQEGLMGQVGKSGRPSKRVKARTHNRAIQVKKREIKTAFEIIKVAFEIIKVAEKDLIRLRK